MSLKQACCRLPAKGTLLKLANRRTREPSFFGVLSRGVNQTAAKQRSTVVTAQRAERYRSLQSSQGFRSFSSHPISSGALRATRAYSHAMADEDGQPGEGAGVVGGNKPKLTIDIVSDTMCPWCFVGKKNLEKAMALSKDKYDFEVVWRPYQLNPDAPKEGMNKRNYYRQKFGEAKTKMIIERMTEVFKSLGYAYSMDGLVGNSLDSHRLLEFAKEQNKQNEVCEELFLNSFVRAKYNGHMDNLVEAAETAGITGAREFLEDPDAGVAQVRDDLRTYARGVTGVPHFIINGQVELSGAQPPSAMLDAFEDAVSAVA